MSRKITYFGALLASGAFAGVALAQEWNLSGASAIEGDATAVVDGANDEIGKINDDDRYEDHWNTDGWKYSLGFSANLAQGEQVKKGVTTETSNENYALSAVIKNGQGRYEQSFSLMSSYARKNEEKPQTKLSTSYHIASSIGSRSYAFSTIGAKSVRADVETLDAFAGFGIGTRLLSSETLAWRVEAGPSIHYTTAKDLGTTNAFGAIAKSEFFLKLSDTVSLSNATEVQWTEAFQKLSNDFGINFALNENLTARVGYISDYHYNDAQKLTDQSNNLRISTVLQF